MRFLSVGENDQYFRSDRFSVDTRPKRFEIDAFSVEKRGNDVWAGPFKVHQSYVIFVAMEEPAPGFKRLNDSEENVSLLAW